MPIIIIKKKNRKTLEERVFNCVKEDFKTAAEIAKILNRPISCVNICLQNLKRDKRVKHDKYTNQYTF